MANRKSFDTAVPMLSQNYASGAVVERRQYGSRDGPTPAGAYGNTSSQSALATGSGVGGAAANCAGKLGQRNSLMLFERASPSWWNPRFASKLLENQYLRCAFPQIRLRFRFGLTYVALSAFVWFMFHAFVSDWTYSLIYQLSSSALICLLVLILLFTFNDNLYQRFYAPAGFLCAFILIVISLLFFCVQNSLISPIGTFASSLEIVLLLYTVIPLPLYICASCGLIYSILFEILTVKNLPYEYVAVKFALHLCAHLLGVHLFILTQVRNRKTFIKIGQSLLASKDLEIEKQFKDNMIESVMPRKVAEELLKETIEFRRPSTASAARCSIFRPFTMNLMTDVSILFADIAGFTKMSSNKSADELVNLLNDLFGRFDKLCTATGCEKISTLGDCYYCVSGCPEPRPDHAQCCVEMGLAMCVAIKEFDRDRNQDVNMRVGIHTGVVMCGIVGTKRFKFDVFSNDVNLANTMESSGRAGFVHLSENTKNFLGNDYVLEEGEVVESKKKKLNEIMNRPIGPAAKVVTD